MRSDDVTHRPHIALAVAVAALAVGAAACGDLDNVTTVKDLRVLAVKSEPAGFLVPLDAPSSLKDTTATLTALIVDPKQPGGMLTTTAQACPDYIDTITAASGKSSRLCPDASATAALPPPLDTALATTDLPMGMSGPIATSPIEYDPTLSFGLSSDQLGLFFSPSLPMDPMTPPQIAQAIKYNRDFSFDAIVDMTFGIGDETAQAIKRVVYWPLLPADLLNVPPDADLTFPHAECPTSQTPNTNPELSGIGFFSRRDDGIPAGDYGDGTVPTISIATDALFAQPAYPPEAVEHYFLRVNNASTNMVETQCFEELLTFQFFASSGTFDPAERTSHLSPLLTLPANQHVPIDSKWKPPKPEELPADGNVTVWVVSRDERAGVAWLSRTFKVTP
jgi:hypothetical protein